MRKKRPIWANHPLVWDRFGPFIEEFHQPFQVLHDSDEGGLLVHFFQAPVARFPQTMRLLGFSEEVFDSMTQPIRNFVATGFGEFPGGVENPELFQP